MAAIAVVVAVGAFAAVVSLLDDERSSSSASTTTSTAPSTTSTSTAAGGSWFAVLRSDLDDRITAAQLEPEVSPFGDRGQVIDTDEFRTGDGRPPDYFPTAGVIAAVVGPFASHDAVAGWCAAERAPEPCTVRQLVPA
jgi:hypothetical protein